MYIVLISFTELETKIDIWCVKNALTRFIKFVPNVNRELAIDSKVMEKLLGLLDKSEVTRGAVKKILMLPALDEGAKKLFEERIQDQIFSLENKKLEKQERWYDFIKLAEKDFGLKEDMFLDEESLLKLFS